MAALPLLFAATFSRAADPVVYSQPYSVGSYTTWASCASTGNAYATGYDNFTLGATTSVTAVQWHGNYAARTPADNPIAPNTDSFTFSFYADDGGAPGALLATGTVAMADCAAQSLGTVGLVYDTGGASYQVPFYAYRAALPTAFTAQAGQKYWLSIVGNTSNQDLWGWYSGSGGDNTSIQDFGGRIDRPLDRNFILEGMSEAAATPTVSAAATVAKADANAGTPGVFTLTLSAPATTKVKVKYLLGGTAVNGQDYAFLKGVAKFKPGQSSLDIQVVPPPAPVGVSFDAFKKTVLLTLQPGDGYTVGTTSKVKVKILRSAGIILP